MASETQEILEEAMDVMEETIDLMEQTKLHRVEKFVIGGGLVTAFAIGAATGYFFAKKRLTQKYSQIAQNEIEEAREFYAARNKTGEFADPTKLAEKYIEGNEMAQLEELVKPYRSGDGVDLALVKRSLEEVSGKEVTIIPYSPDDDKEEEKAVLSEEVVNVFTQSEPDPDFDYEAEMRMRTEEAPYVITHDEFMASEKDYEQTTLTYYEGDDVLSDEKDKPIDDTDNVVGNYNLERFGHGSRDNNVVYVRNDILEHEFEIVRHRGKYTEQVLGFIEHSDRGRPRRFRSDDD